MIIKLSCDIVKLPNGKEVTHWKISQKELRGSSLRNAAEIEAFLQPIADEIGVEIVEVEFKQGHSPALTVYIDKRRTYSAKNKLRYRSSVDLDGRSSVRRYCSLNKNIAVIIRKYPGLRKCLKRYRRITE